MDNERYQKKKYKKHANRSLTDAHKTFLINRLRAEWEAAERAAHQSVMHHAYGRGAFTKDVLMAAALLGGIVLIAIVAPKAIVLFDAARKLKHFVNAPDPRKKLRRARLDKYIDLEKVDDTTYRVTLTKKGDAVFLRGALDRLRIHQSGAWDGAWWIVIFDIPRKHNVVRNILRDKLKRFGMYPLQKSVLVSPYPCQEEVELIAYLYHASDFIRVIRAEYISDQEDLRKFFNI